MSYLELNWLWDEKFWFPPNITWDQFETSGNARYASPSDLIYVAPLAIVMLLIRFQLKSYIYEPIAKFIGVKGLKLKPPESNLVLKEVYESMKSSHKTRSQKNNEIKRLSTELDMAEKKICQWFRDMEKYEKSNKMDSFTKCAWEMTFYTLNTIYGLASLWKMSWFWNIKDYFENASFHNIENEIWWFFMVSMAYFVGDIYTQIFNVKRKDKMAFIIHHVIVIVTLVLAFITHFHRIGTVLLVLSDICTPFFHVGRMCVYTGFYKMSKLLLVCFSLLWFVTRMAIFPLLIWQCYLFIWDLDFTMPAYYAMLVGLLGIMALNVIWSYLLLMVIYKTLYKPMPLNKSFSDPLSDSEDSNGEENISNDFKKKKSN